MQYSIFVFNREKLGKISKEMLLNAITESNYETLCRQYGLEPSLIEPSLNSLEVLGALNDSLSFFMVKYGEAQRRALVVQQWDAEIGGGKNLIQEVIEGINIEPLRSRLRETRRVVEITLAPEQLKDMGLLLAYEIARWSAERGSGIVYGLDGSWYRLNQYKAFIPIGSSGK